MESYSQLFLDTEFLEEHGLLGAYQKNHPKVKQQMLINMQYFKELERLENLLMRLSLQDIYLVKGAVLIRDVYSDFSQRGMSDVDLYIPDVKKYQHFQSILKDEGYEILKEKKWQANNFKTTMIKKIGQFHCTLELHQKLLWKEKQMSWEKIQVEGFWGQLTINDHLAYLIAHMGKQHSFLKIFWLLDIKKMVEKYNNVIDWSMVYQKLKVLNCSTCLKITAELLHQLFDMDLNDQIRNFSFSRIKFFIQKFVFSPRYFITKKRKTWRVLVAKFLVKDNNFETLEYLFHYKRAK